VPRGKPQHSPGDRETSRLIRRHGKAVVAEVLALAIAEAMACAAAFAVSDPDTARGARAVVARLEFLASRRNLAVHG